MMTATATTVCFIACHAGPAEHFSTFTKNLSEDISVKIYASGPAIDKFNNRNVEIYKFFDLEDLSPEDEDDLAIRIATVCKPFSAVMTDVGHPFNIKIQNALAIHAPTVTRIAYYDNPESYVPGGYSSTAATVMLAAQKILFANSNLATESIKKNLHHPIDFGSRERIGIGFYPLAEVESVKEQRSKRLRTRDAIFNKSDLILSKEKIAVYFGGNNSEYFDEALPAFLNRLTESLKMEQKNSKQVLNKYLILLQQHPGAKRENKDGELIQKWVATHGHNVASPKLMVSPFNSTEAQIIADMAMYHQTSMGPQLALEGIPTFQVSHQTYKDILITNQLAESITNPTQFLEVFNKQASSIQKPIDKALIYKKLGIKEDWADILAKSLKVENQKPSRVNIKYLMGLGFAFAASYITFKIMRFSK